MNHDYVDEHGIAARYVSRTLSADQEREFEAHLVDCPRCVDEVQFGEALRTGLREPVFETTKGGISAPSSVPRVPPTRRPTRVSAWAPAFAAAAVLVLAIGGFGYLRTYRQLADARSRAAESDLAYRQAQSQIAALEKRPTPPAPTVSDSDLASKMLVVDLDTTRGATPGPVNAVVTVPPATEFLVFTIQIGQTSDYPRYRAAFRAGSGAPLLTSEDVRAASPTAVALVVPARLFSPGNYVVRLEGLDRNGQAFSIGSYAFRVVPPRK